VTRGIVVHLLDQAALLLLGLRTLGELSAGVAEPEREGVAGLLELPEREQPGAAMSAHAPVEPLPRPRGAGELSELALELRDLVPQRAAGGKVVRNRPRPRRREGCPPGHAHPPIGALGLEPQKTWVPTIPTRCTRTVFSTIDLAVAVPTPTGPPDAV
jgi:hypothetical protein